MSARPEELDPSAVAANALVVDAKSRYRSRREPSGPPSSDRSLLARFWYRMLQVLVLDLQLVAGGIRATGRENIPSSGGALLVSNHLSHYDVFVLGLLLRRYLNYVARSSLFKPLLGPLIRSVGGFPIQRDGTGAQGMKETLRRLRAGGVVTFFPEGTRSADGALGPLRPGIAALAGRAGVPIIPAGIAGTFEAWPRSRAFPRPHAIRVHYGPPILPGELEGSSAAELVAVLDGRLHASVAIARQALNRDLGRA